MQLFSLDASLQGEDDMYGDYLMNDDFPQVSGAVPADGSGSCDPFELNLNRYPPQPVLYSKVSRSGSKYSWNISKSSNGQGEYVAEASSVSSVYLPSTSEPWHASYAFDHDVGTTDATSVWQKSSGSTDPHWLTLEMPDTISLAGYTLSSRKSCCASEFPKNWVLYCVHNSDKLELYDNQTNQVLGINQCKMYIPILSREYFLSPPPCKKFKIVMEGFSSLREWALYGSHAPTTTTTAATTTTVATTTGMSGEHVCYVRMYICRVCHECICVCFVRTYVRLFVFIATCDAWLKYRMLSIYLFIPLVLSYLDTLPC